MVKYLLDESNVFRRTKALSSAMFKVAGTPKAVLQLTHKAVVLSWQHLLLHLAESLGKGRYLVRAVEFARLLGFCQMRVYDGDNLVFFDLSLHCQLAQAVRCHWAAVDYAQRITAGHFVKVDIHTDVLICSFFLFAYHSLFSLLQKLLCFGNHIRQSTGSEVVFNPFQNSRLWPVLNAYATRHVWN